MNSAQVNFLGAFSQSVSCNKGYLHCVHMYRLLRTVYTCKGHRVHCLILQDYRMIEKPPKYQEKVEVEASYFDIQGHTAHYS